MAKRVDSARLPGSWPLLLPGVFVIGTITLLRTGRELPLDPGVVLLLAVAVLAAVMSVPVVTRLWAQAVVVASTVLLVVAAGWSTVDVLGSSAALVVVAIVVDRAAVVLAALRSEQAADRARLERRLDLLTAMEDLPDAHDEAVRASVRILRDLGFDSAAVSLVRGGLLYPELLDGVSDPGPQPLGHGLAGRAIRTDSTVVTGDYLREPDRDVRISGEHAVVVAPVRMDARPVGAVMCSRSRLGVPTGAEVETVEVLAAHLGGVLTVLERERRQAELLRRATRLDDLRTRLITVVSDDIRTPIAEVHRAVDALEVQVRSAAAPVGDLARLRSVAAELSAMVTATLSVARRRPETAAGDPRAVPLVALIAELEAATGCTVKRLPEPSPAWSGRRVWLALDLWLSAMELLVDGHGGPGGVEVEVVVAPEGAELRLHARLEVRPPPVVLGLAADLLDAAGVRCMMPADTAADPEPVPASVRLVLPPPPEAELG